MIDAPRLRTIPPAPGPDGGSKRICIVTSEFVGPWKNGGIGTAMTGLAELLARAGHEVTVFYTRGHFLTGAQCAAWTARLARVGISFIPTRPRDFRNVAGPAVGIGFVVPAVVVRFLRERSFDIIHFSDTGGQGYLVAAARRFGLGFENTRIVTGLHSPTRWTTLLNESPTSPLLQVVEEVEQVTIGCSDVVWSPSRYLVEWMIAHGLPLPPSVVLQQYVLPSAALSASGAAATPAGDVSGLQPIKTIVFFGRLEKRKGLGLFLEFLGRNRQWIAAAGLDVVFMGSIGSFAGERADIVIRRGAAGWTFPWRIESALGQAEAVAFLKSPGKLAIIASPEDNSPCTVYEAVEHRIPFAAAATGGIPEIIHPNDHARTSFRYDEKALRGCIEAAVAASAAPLARHAIPPSENAARWLAFHAAPERWAEPKAESRNGPSGIVAVLLATPRASDSMATVASLIELGPRLRALLLVGGREERLAGNPVRVAPRELGRVLREMAAQHPDCGMVFIRSGVTFDVQALLGMVDKLRPGEADGLMPAAATTGGKVVEPLPFSSRLRGIVDPLGTGVIALSAAAVAAGLEALGDEGAKSLPDLVGDLAAEGLRLFPYPAVVATLPERLAKRDAGINGLRRARGWPGRSPGMLARGERGHQVRRLATLALCSPLGSALPYTIALAGTLRAVVGALTRAR